MGKRVLNAIAKAIFLMALLTFGGLFLVAVTVLSILTGIPMAGFSAGIVALAVVWEVLEGVKKNGKR